MLLFSNDGAHIPGSFVCFELLETAAITGGKFGPRVTPLRLLVHGGVCQVAKGTNRLAVGADGSTGKLCSGRLIHEGHELVREAWHRTTDADPAHIRAASDACHPTSFRHVAIHHGSPAAKLHDAFGGTVGSGEIALFVVSGAIAALMHGFAEQPCRPQLIVQRDHRSQARYLIEQ